MYHLSSVTRNRYWVTPIDNNRPVGPIAQMSNKYCLDTTFHAPCFRSWLVSTLSLKNSYYNSYFRFLFLKFFSFYLFFFFLQSLQVYYEIEQFINVWNIADTAIIPRQSINQSPTQSINQSIDQSINHYLHVTLETVDAKIQ